MKYQPGKERNGTWLGKKYQPGKERNRTWLAMKYHPGWETNITLASNEISAWQAMKWERNQTG
jgi:hypothetical protein